jgi:hypothetical protein
MRLCRSALSERAKDGRFPFPFPSGCIGGKRETPRLGRAYSRGPGESVTRGDRQGRELWFGIPSLPLAGPHEWHGAMTREPREGEFHDS